MFGKCWRAFCFRGWKLPQGLYNRSKLWLFQGSVWGFSGKTPGKSRENCWKIFPESRAKCYKFWDLGHRERRTCQEPWVHTACTLCPPSPAAAQNRTELRGSFLILSKGKATKFARTRGFSKLTRFRNTESLVPSWPKLLQNNSLKRNIFVVFL